MPSASTAPAINQQLAAHKFVNNFQVTLCRRLTSLFLPYTLDFQNFIDGRMASLKKNSVSVALTRVGLTVGRLRGGVVMKNCSLVFLDVPAVRMN